MELAGHTSLLIQSFQHSSHTVVEEKIHLDGIDIKKNYPPRLSYDRLRPQNLIFWVFQNLPISDQVIRLRVQKVADRILEFLSSAKTGKLHNVNISQRS